VPAGEAWLPIRRAADLLGVSPATVRLWTAAGKLRAVVTPGGHRRYAEDELRRLLAEVPGTEWDAAAAELVQALRARYAQLARGEVQRQHWFHAFDGAARARVHELGEALLAQVACFLAVPGARERAALMRSNVAGTRNLLAAARRAGAGRTVYTSSVAAIGVKHGAAADETFQSPPERLIGAYKLSKYLAEREAVDAARAGQAAARQGAQCAQSAIEDRRNRP